MQKHVVDAANNLYFKRGPGGRQCQQQAQIQQPAAAAAVGAASDHEDRSGPQPAIEPGLANTKGHQYLQMMALLRQYAW